MEGNIQAELNSGKCDSIHKKKNLKERMIKKQIPKIMGILNITPDSFYDGGETFGLEEALKKFHRMVEEGADIIDVGAVSSRPFAKPVTYEEERERLFPFLQRLEKTPVPLSIDTTNPDIAKDALKWGATLINDIYGFENKELRRVVKDYKSKLCVMHMQGNPQTMQINPYYQNGVMNELMVWFEKKINILIREGISPSHIIIDPGIGFGKTVLDCLTILKNLSDFTIFGCPILIGLSRKSFMSKILGKPATQLLSTTITLNTMSIIEGAEIIRVHDVKEHRDMIDVLKPLFCQN